MGPRREAGQTTPLRSVQLSQPFCFMSATVCATIWFQALGAFGSAEPSAMAAALAALASALAEGFLPLAGLSPLIAAAKSEGSAERVAMICLSSAISFLMLWFSSSRVLMSAAMVWLMLSMDIVGLGGIEGVFVGVLGACGGAAYRGHPPFQIYS